MSDGTRRWGLLDLGLAMLIVSFTIQRTPVGVLAHYGFRLITEDNPKLPSLMETFDNGMTSPLAPDLQLVSTPATTGGFPEPYRTAVASLLKDAPPSDMTMTRLDQVYQTHPDPEQALLHWALQPAQVARAIARAKATGATEPERYTNHRRFLGTNAQDHADKWVRSPLALASALSITWPVQGPHRVSSPFGYRTHPTLGTKKFHNGIDLAVPIGTPLVAAADGRVSVSSSNAVSGNYVIIDHGNGVRTSYCHLNKRLVTAGAHVKAGQHFADSGNTGRSTGPHLHFIMKLAGEAVDPARFRPKE